MVSLKDRTMKEDLENYLIKVQELENQIRLVNGSTSISITTPSSMV
jgi:hypothetical protein